MISTSNRELHIARLLHYHHPQSKKVATPTVIQSEVLST
jgi:hypothetical protein